jgi:hypothetical protein
LSALNRVIVVSSDGSARLPQWDRVGTLDYGDNDDQYM